MGIRFQLRPNLCKIMFFNNNLVLRVLSFPSPGARERETLGNAGHVSPTVWEMTKHNIEGMAGKSAVMVRIFQPLPLCYVLPSPRFWVIIILFTGPFRCYQFYPRSSLLVHSKVLIRALPNPLLVLTNHVFFFCISCSPAAQAIVLEESYFTFSSVGEMAGYFFCGSNKYT